MTAAIAEVLEAILTVIEHRAKPPTSGSYITAYIAEDTFRRAKAALREYRKGDDDRNNQAS